MWVRGNHCHQTKKAGIAGQVSGLCLSGWRGHCRKCSRGPQKLIFRKEGLWPKERTQPEKRSTRSGKTHVERHPISPADTRTGQRVKIKNLDLFSILYSGWLVAPIFPYQPAEHCASYYSRCEQHRPPYDFNWK